MEDPNAVVEEQKKENAGRSVFGRKVGEARKRASDEMMKDFTEIFKFKNPEQVEIVGLIIRKNLTAFSADILDAYLTDLAQVREIFDEMKEEGV